MVDVSTPASEPVQLNGTMKFGGFGVPKNTVIFPPSKVVASVILNVYGTLTVPEQKPVVVTTNVPCPFPLPELLVDDIEKVKEPDAD